MKFTAAHTAAFRDASHDRNPLHLDAAIARRTQFGKPVVYGMAAVLFGLGAWANGRFFKLKSLKVVFRKALFEEEEYDLKIESSGDESTIRFKRDTVDYLVIIVACTWQDGPFAECPKLFPPFHPLQEPLVSPQHTVGKYSYRMNEDAWPQLTRAFGLTVQTMPTQQLAALLWASYHVGMVFPGRQALFSAFQMAFSDEDPRSADILLDLQKVDFDDRFNRLTLDGRGIGIDSLQIVAFLRPLPVDFPLSEMAPFEDDFLPLNGKVVFISGATRGFGASMARMCALAGATLALNYRGDDAAAQAICTEIEEFGSEVAAFAGDMSNPSQVAAMAKSISERFGKIDVIVNNAAPPIRDLLFREQDNVYLMQFVQQNLAITAETARHLLPLVPKGGHFLHISTKYLDAPVRGFAHYLAAKAAQEALIQALSLEFFAQEFVVVRMPRILTDQTNLAFDFDPPSNPGQVARAAILALLDSDATENYRLIRLYDIGR